MENAEIIKGEELERKTLEALSTILNDYEQGAISQPTASYALRSVFHATSGIVGNETFELMSNASKEVNADEGRDVVRRVFFNPDKKELVLLEYQFGEAEVVLKRGKYPMTSSQVNIWDKSSKATFESEINPFEAARKRFTGYADSLLRAGFQEML